MLLFFCFAALKQSVFDNDKSEGFRVTGSDLMRWNLLRVIFIGTFGHIFWSFMGRFILIGGIFHGKTFI